MSCAWRLKDRVDLTVYEAEPEPGGHTHTVDIMEGGAPVPVDTGFMVYNETTYPLLTQLFKELGVTTVETDMSFGVQYRPDNLEFCGSGLSQLFAQRRNLLNPRFLGMLRDVVRFNKRAAEALEDPRVLTETLEDFVQRHGFGRAFLEYYLVPMTSAIWSTPPDEMLRFPAHTLLRFMFNHGLLGIRTHHQWRTVQGGSRQYRDRLIAPFRERIHCRRAVRSVRRLDNQISVIDDSGEVRRFDRVVMATHADTTVRLLDNPTPEESRLLSCFPYASNTITLHSDPVVMPTRRPAWASWNYRIDALGDGTRQASTHYWMNALQHIPGDKPYFVSVNEPGIVSPDLTHRSFTFDHPMFSKEAADAQLELPNLNQAGRVFFCGSYFRYGFHEDGLLSGYAAADSLLQQVASDHAQLAL